MHSGLKNVSSIGQESQTSYRRIHRNEEQFVAGGDLKYLEHLIVLIIPKTVNTMNLKLRTKKVTYLSQFQIYN